MRTRQKKLLSSQVIKKTLTASSNQPSPKIDPDPTAKSLAEESTSLIDPDTSPMRYLPDEEEVNKDLLHQVLDVNAVTRSKAIPTEALPSQEAIETVFIPYTEQLSHPFSELTHKSNSVKKLAQILLSVQVSNTLDTLKTLKTEFKLASEAFLLKSKGLDMNKIRKISSPNYEDQQNCTYIELVVQKLRVQAILDSGAPGNIVLTRLVKKLKLVLDLDYEEEFRTDGPERTKAMGAYSSLLLWFDKLVVTALTIVLCKNSYDILIGTSFMATYRIMINHKDSTFSILGHLVPMFYHGDGPKDPPTKKIHHNNMEDTDGDITIAYTLRQQKIKNLPLATK
ncbi:hypothetical protein DSO57_1015265 [Entomophthora muscae]|uniref:Uncharacterized protein n=1 Tax=Entomophthora muscae TaxID=34485 RepID=A0ACC2T5N9_9FUNG|nr:hypothetical protein DSO57_1015265 [Entomophthora muscae]